MDAAPDLAAAPSAAAPKWCHERILSRKLWTPRLLSFEVSRPPGFRFAAGHYARLGLAGADGATVWRPFSMASAPDDDHLEFVAALVANGEFSRHLAAAGIDGEILVEKLSYGFLTIDQLAPGTTLWMLSSGTGIGPFISILRDPTTWRAFDRLVLAHSVRHADELVYRDEVAALADARRTKMTYLPIVTREALPDALPARIPQLIADGRLESAAGAVLDVATARVMVCGNPELTRDMRALLTARGFATSRRGIRGQMAFEKYW